MGNKQIEKRWEVKRRAKIFSGLKLGEMKKLISKGLIKENDLILHRGHSKWRRAGEQEELKPFFEKLKKK